MTCTGVGLGFPNKSHIGIFEFNFARKTWDFSRCLLSNQRVRSGCACIHWCRLLLFFFGCNGGEILGYSSVHCASVCGVFCDVKSREKSFQ